jgi:lysophospholipase L1-like esterase
MAPKPATPFGSTGLRARHAEPAVCLTIVPAMPAPAATPDPLRGPATSPPGPPPGDPSPPPSAGVRRRRALRLALALAGLGLGLLLGEGAVRLAGVAPEVGVATYGRFRLARNPRLGYEPVPDLDHQGDVGRGFDFKGRSNGMGFRDRDHPLAKPAGTLRILVLGDSLAWGFAVRRSDAIFPYLLERNLERQGLKAEVLNFGVSGYNTMQEVAMLEDRGLAYRPDLVLLAYCLNDRTEAAGGLMEGLLARERKSASRFAFLASPWLMRSHLWRTLRYHPTFASWSKKADPPAQGLYADFGEDRVEPSFAELATLARSHRFRVLVAVFPYLEGIVSYRHGEEHEAVRRLAERHRFAFVDLLAPLQECRVQRGRIRVDRWHLNETGHSCAAEALARAVRELASAP